MKNHYVTVETRIEHPLPLTLRLIVISLLAITGAMVISTVALAQRGRAVRENYQKFEYHIPMRDGVKLFTVVYVPRDAASDKTYPMLMQRTCYSVAPYGEDAYRGLLGPSRQLQEDGYIFVYQDVRGCYMSGGTFRT